MGGAGTHRRKIPILETRLAPHGLGKIQLESSNKHSKSMRVGAVLWAGQVFCHALMVAVM
jgi:hypothetical protein